MCLPFQRSTLSQKYTPVTSSQTFTVISDYRTKIPIKFLILQKKKKNNFSLEQLHFHNITKKSIKKNKKRRKKRIILDAYYFPPFLQQYSVYVCVCICTRCESLNSALIRALLSKAPRKLRKQQQRENFRRHASSSNPFASAAAPPSCQATPPPLLAQSGLKFERLEHQRTLHNANVRN